jgi:hypothetical protein
MQNKMNQANLAKLLIPAAADAMGGHLAGIGAAATFLSPMGNSILSNSIQNPLIQQLLKASKPFYYGAGRSAINLGNEQNR